MKHVVSIRKTTSKFRIEGFAFSLILTCFGSPFGGFFDENRRNKIYNLEYGFQKKKANKKNALVLFRRIGFWFCCFALVLAHTLSHSLTLSHTLSQSLTLSHTLSHSLTGKGKKKKCVSLVQRHRVLVWLFWLLVWLFCVSLGLKFFTFRWI